MQDVWVRIFNIVLVVEYFCSPICLDENVARREKEGKGEKIGGKSGGQNVQSYGRALGRIKLVGWIVLIGVIDEATPLVATKNLYKPR